MPQPSDKPKPNNKPLALVGAAPYSGFDAIDELMRRRRRRRVRAAMIEQGTKIVSERDEQTSFLKNA